MFPDPRFTVPPTATAYSQPLVPTPSASVGVLVPAFHVPLKTIAPDKLLGIWLATSLPSLPNCAIPLVAPMVATAGTDMTPLPLIVILDASTLTPPSTVLLEVGNE